ncbi:MAG: hypothetical protein P8X90_09080, partial [Desulfobacterales bacterium]
RQLIISSLQALSGPEADGHRGSTLIVQGYIKNIIISRHLINISFLAGPAAGRGAVGLSIKETLIMR